MTNDEPHLAVLRFAVDRLNRSGRRPVVIGIQAPQGAGKTTMTGRVMSQLPPLGLRGATVSVDDFYLTRTEQLALAARHPGNRYLEHRGYPGTHDVRLGEQTIQALRALGPGTDGQSVRVPVYDKSAHGGRGDRLARARWRQVTGPLDLVFVEGWMLGFMPADEADLVDPDMAEPNRALVAYAGWYGLIDAWVVLRPVDPDYVLQWRIDAEESARRSGRPALSRADIEDYVRRFLPAYRLYGQTDPPAAPDAIFTSRLDLARRLLPP